MFTKLKLTLIAVLGFLVLPGLVFASVGEINPASPGAERILITNDGGLAVYSASGKLLSGFPVWAEGVFEGNPIVGNFDGVVGNEICVVERKTSGEYYLHLYSSTGTEISNVMLYAYGLGFDIVSLYNYNLQKYTVLYSSAAGDVQELTLNSGIWTATPIVVGTSLINHISTDNAKNKFYYAVDGESEIQVYQRSSGWNLVKTINVSGPVLSRVVDDGNGELWYLSNDKLYAYSASGTIATGFPIILRDSGANLIVADIDKNNAGLEVVVQLTDGSVSLYNYSGQLLKNKFTKEKFSALENISYETEQGIFAYSANNNLVIKTNSNVDNTSVLNTGVTPLFNKSIDFTSTTGQIDPKLIPPNPVTGLSTSSSAPETVVLNWNTYVDNQNDFNRFEIYRSTNTTTLISGLSPINTSTNMAMVSYTDNVTSGIYYYLVVVVDNDGNLTSSGDWLGPVNVSKVVPPSVINLAYSFEEQSGSTSFVDNVSGLVMGCGASYCPEAGVIGISGKALQFNGVNNFTYINNNEIISATDQITLETWIKPQPSSNYYSVVITKGFNYEISITNDGSLRAGITNASNIRAAVDAYNVVKMYQWNHLALTYDGSMIRAYVNGVKVGEQPQTGAIKNDSTPLLVGSLGDDRYPFFGTIDEIKFYKQTLTGAEIMAEYNNLKPVPVVDNELIYKLNEPVGSNQFFDQASIFPLACLGDQCPTANVPGISGTALQFDGTNDLISANDSEYLEPGQALTLETWVKPYASSNHYAVVASKGLNYELTISNDGSLRTGIVNAADTRVVFDTPNVVTLSQWNHIVLTYDGSMVRAYVNGVKVGEEVQTGAIKNDNTPLLVGNYNSNYPFFGTIDEIKFYKRVLTDEEIATEYNNSKPVPIDINSFEYKLNEPANSTKFFDTASLFPLGCSGDQCPIANVLGISGTALQFDGTNDLITANDSEYLEPGQALTLEAWIKPESFSNQYAVVATKELNYELTISNDGSLRTGITNASDVRVVFDTPNVIKTSQWNHIVLTYDGSMIRVYANGVKVGEQPQTGAVKNDNSPLLVGSYNNNYFFSGSMDEIKFYKRVLTDAEITAEYNALAPVSSSGTLDIYLGQPLTVSSTAAGSNAVVLGRFELEAKVEDIKINNLSLNITGFENISGLNLFIDGQPIGSQVFLSGSSLVIDNLNYVLNKDQRVIVELRADILPEAQVPGMFVTVNNISAEGNSSGSVINAGGLPLELQHLSLTVPTNLGTLDVYLGQPLEISSVATGSIGIVLGRFELEPKVEDVKINNLSLNISGFENISGLNLFIDGQPIGSQITLSGSNVVIDNLNYVLNKDQRVIVELRADILSEAQVPEMFATINNISAEGNASGSVINAGGLPLELQHINLLVG